MVSEETVDRLWHEWLWIFGASAIFYSILYRFAFEKQLSHSNALTIFTIKSHSIHTNVMPPIDEKQSIDETSENLENLDKPEIPETKTKKKEEEEMYTPENCMKYSSCVLSVINCAICTLAGFSIIYHRYWLDPIYGEPGIPFYASATCQAYFLIDVGGDIIVYFWYNLSTFRWDVFIHHCFALSVVPWMMIPKPIYAWLMMTVALSFEISTISLNGTFFCKWYNKSDSITMKFKLGFVITWFLVRVPGSIGLVVWLILFRDRLYNEYPLEKFIGCIVLIAFNFCMQGLWTILIIRKTYRTLAKAENARDAVGGFDLKRRSSIEVRNVTSEA